MEIPETCRNCKNNDQCIRNVPLFASLNRETVHALTAKMGHKRYQKGEIIVHEGDRAEGFTVIQKGSAKAYRMNADGREQILYIFPVNDYFGARFLLTEEEVPYTVEALEESEVCILSTEQFRTLLYTQPEVAIEIIEAMANRMRVLESAMQSMGGRNAELRIASLLIEFRRPYGREVDGYTVIDLPLSREGLANYLGLARETLSRKLNDFEEEGIITLIGARSVRINDRERIGELAGIPF
ncbi:MAG TPA: Crp/Fnr family transcriptional regulator [Sphaerochaeta sp.]|jgi:CRP-like cAMP-binding protein|nr:Crp/Fnr family transcriptional regulator [Sphaerochaeta sp.]